MGQPLRIEAELHDAVEDLLLSGYVKNGTRAYDVAEQVVHLGYTSLSEEQHVLFESFLTPALETRQQELWALQGGC
jgi:hypothetical protein